MFSKTCQDHENTVVAPLFQFLFIDFGVIQVELSFVVPARHLERRRKTIQPITSLIVVRQRWFLHRQTRQTKLRPTVPSELSEDEKSRMHDKPEKEGGEEKTYMRFF